MINKQAIIFTFFMLLTACGYHLRGSIELPEELKRIYLIGGGQFYTQLKKTLKYSSGKLVDSPEEAGLVIKVMDEKVKSRVLSLSNAGRATEFELSYQMDFELYDNQENLLVKKQQINIRRDYFDSQVDQLAKGNERNIIWEEIYRQAVRTVLDRARFTLEARKK